MARFKLAGVFSMISESPTQHAGEKRHQAERECHQFEIRER